jgi:hypothetical protein
MTREELEIKIATTLNHHGGPSDLLPPDEFDCCVKELADALWPEIQEAVSYADRRCPYDCESCHMGPDGMTYDHPDDMPDQVL